MAVKIKVMPPQFYQKNIGKFWNTTRGKDQTKLHEQLQILENFFGRSIKSCIRWFDEKNSCKKSCTPQDETWAILRNL